MPLAILILLVTGCKQQNNSDTDKNLNEQYESSKTDNVSKTENFNDQNIDHILDVLNNPSRKDVLVIAHRGDWRYAPENSLEAVQRCIDLGVDIVELDFRLTKDGHLIAMHDKTVDRTTNGTGSVSDFTLSGIKKLRLKNGCGVKGSQIQIPTLEEIMELAKGKIMINLDKTEGETVAEAYRVLKKTGTVNHAILKGNDGYDVMRERFGAVMDSIIYMPKLWYKNKDVAGFYERFENTINPIMYETLFDTEEAETFTLIPTIKKNGDNFVAIALWDELVAGHTDEKVLNQGPDASWGWLIKHGADAIMTDRPEELVKYLQSKGLHN